MRRQLDPSIKPDKYDKEGPLFYKSKIDFLTTKQIQAGNYFIARVKYMTIELDAVNEQVTDYTKIIGNSLDNMVAQEKKLVESVKTTSGKLRDATQKLSDGLSKVEKVANFDRLERYANMLERIERALSSLAELEQSGKLGKITQALNSK
jgi:hypothetical protein